MTAHGLIDATEMHLKAILELNEDDVVPLRARIADRLGRKASTVSQTISRMERDGLVLLRGDGRVALSEPGRAQAVGVLRKHRLAEVLLHREIGLEWPRVHAEACRWEHVLSEKVERRIFELCGRPTLCPYGNPIPGLDGLWPPGEPRRDEPRPSRPAGQAVLAGQTTAVISRISDRVQDDAQFLRTLHTAGMHPGAPVSLTPLPGDEVRLSAGDHAVTLSRYQAETLMVSDPSPIADPAPPARHPTGRTRVRRPAARS
ncbi:metal-dependent transcriptional regulator [Spirillospora sp. CA-294931]|uniref:metal-dependent transcriptional regulator n=1 Tax=Spirillospora sp. CA-294931 TaxID=3240042 RepID=UPI003D8AC162